MLLLVLRIWRSRRCVALLGQPVMRAAQALMPLGLVRSIRADALANEQTLTSKEAMDGKSVKAAHAQIEAEVCARTSTLGRGCALSGAWYFRE